MKNRSPDRLKRIGLAFQLGAPFQERVTHGILEYAQKHGPWEIVSSPEGAALPMEGLANWDGDGVIAMLETRKQVKLAQSLPVPIVNLANSLRTPNIPTVSSHQRMIGEWAAGHLLRRNFRRFAFYGLKDVWYSAERCAGFVERVNRAGFECDSHEAESSLLAEDPWSLDREALGAWLESLDRPTGIFAVHDYRARMVLERCSDLGLRVPEEVAVIGVDDDPIVCHFSKPPLTSIRQNGSRVGFEAARLLDKLISGKSAEISGCLIEPESLVERESTGVLAVEDASLREFIHLVESHCSELVDIPWLVSRLAVSRRHLEKLCREELGKTPHQILCEARIEKAKTILLRDRKLALKEVAHACGFSEPRRFTIVFRRTAGMSPREYRVSGNVQVS